MKMVRVGVGVIACATLLAGCGDPKSASDRNFTAAINEIIKTDNPLCYIVSTQQFPLILRKDGQQNYGAKLEQMDALVKAGALQSSDTETNKSYEGFGGAENSLVPAKAYSLTGAGQAAYRSQLPPNKQWESGGAGLCLGTAEVDDIVSYTEPESQKGSIVSTVTYKYKVKQAEPWADNEEIKKAFPEFAKADGDGIEAKITLERGVKGWRKSQE